MKRATLKLVLAASALYFVVLLTVRGLLPLGFTLPFYFLAAPLLLVVLVLVSDLSVRASVPARTGVKTARSRQTARRMQLLTRQIEVGVGSSKSYYETVLLARLREALADKVSLETGIDRKRVQEILKNRALGPGLLNSQELYRLLYSGAPSRGPERARLLEEAVAAIEAWTP